MAKFKIGANGAFIRGIPRKMGEEIEITDPNEVGREMVPVDDEAKAMHAAHVAGRKGAAEEAKAGGPEARRIKELEKRLLDLERRGGSPSGADAELVKAAEHIRQQDERLAQLEAELAKAKSGKK